jgi:carbamoyl-phosphate synthase large subunit
VPVERLAAATGIDPWFLDGMLQIVEERTRLAAVSLGDATRRDWRRAKRLGFSDAQLAYLWESDEDTVRAARLAAGVDVTYKTVDTCAAEFEAKTPYHYGTFEDEDEVAGLEKPAVVILGSGPNRIGQGVEFDYCCVHAAFALSDAGYETVMVNCNPETVSTDYDTSDRLFFEPLTGEDVLAVCSALAGRGELAGVIVSLGGQTPLKLARTLADAGITILGTSPASIDLAEDRERFNDLCTQLGIPQPEGGTAASPADARAVADGIGYPVLVRPSYVLGGRAMQIVYDGDGLDAAMAELTGTGSLGREGGLSATRPALIDRFLEDAIEVDVDAIRDRVGDVVIGGVMEHIEEAGVHSGDSACAIPPPTLAAPVISTIEAQTRALADALDVRGLLNVQYAVKGGEVSVIEANPRASRTVPFVSKATGAPLAKLAARVMLGTTLDELRDEGQSSAALLPEPGRSNGTHVAVKEAVLPFERFPEVDTLLGPEMRSTGEVMGIDRSFGLAFTKSQAAAGNRLPEQGTVFFSLADRDKPAGLVAARRLAELGFSLVATAGTADALQANGIRVDAVVGKLGESDASGVDAVELISSGKVDLVINTPRGRPARPGDGDHIRRAATAHRVSCVTTVAAALAVASGLAEWSATEPQVRSLQEYHRDHQLRLEV